MLQLYRLTNTDIVELEEEKKNLDKIVKGLEAILAHEEILKNVMKEELRKIKKEYATPRKTEFKEDIVDIKLDTKQMIKEEDVIVIITKAGYVKRCSLRSYKATDDEMMMKDNDYVLGMFKLTTLNTLLVFTNFGNYLYVPVHELPDMKYKDLGKHISNIIALADREEVISVVPVINFNNKNTILLATRDGMIKRSNISDFKVTRYTKPIVCMKLKDNDKLISAEEVKANDIFIATNKGYGLWFDVNEVPVVGLKTGGVKSMKLKDEEIVSVNNFNHEKDEYVSIFTDNKTGKRVKISEFDKSSRARRGLMIIKEVKTNPYRVLKTFVSSGREHVGLITSDINYIKLTELPILDRYSTGGNISKKKFTDVFMLKSLEEKHEDEEVEIKEEKSVKQVSLKEIDDRLMTIDDFLN